MKRRRGTLLSTAEPTRRLLDASPLLVVFCAEVFFAVLTILGLTYEGSSSSNVYLVYLTSVIVALSCVSFRGIFKGGLAVKHLLILFIPGAVLCAFLVDNSMGRIESQSWSTFALWIVFGVPAFIAGIAAAKTMQLLNFSLILEPLMLLFSVATLIYGVGNFTSGLQSSGLGGSTYQMAAYLSALSFGMNLYHIYFGENHSRWRFATTSSYTFVCLLLLPLQALTTLLSGGRGGMVLVGVYSLVLTIFALVYRTKSRVSRGILSLLLLLIAAMLAIPYILQSDFAPRIVQRTFAYLSSDGIDWAGTSGRGVLYEEAWLAIQDSPLVGYGLFSWSIGDFPHNLILELLLNGGVLYLALWAFLFIHIIVRILVTANYNPEVLALLVIMSFSLVTLMFSGTYWSNSGFWYFIGVGLSLRFPYHAKLTKSAPPSSIDVKRAVAVAGE